MAHLELPSSLSVIPDRDALVWLNRIARYFESLAGDKAELIRIEATLWGRFYPVFKEAPHASQCGLWV